MFAPRIWGFDLGSAQARIARAAGWTRADILWEGLMEAGNAAWASGDQSRAATLFTRAHWVAKLRFSKTDPRRATVLVNLAMLDQANGRAGRALSRFDKARAIWRGNIQDSVENMQILPRARSSLFHLRMEARHRDTYHDNMRHRIGKIADETLAVIDALAGGQPPAHRMYARWLGERPNVYDDTRKLLGACLLIVDA
ncbi:BTAD domain-containing putative transcriptional regulator [Roseovarius litorisediminis]|nr:BTAD domain-containing putative transcriptional regulator [Roseovarius litorisediminis]